ncbi:MAG TPA: hypothetical protein PLB62_16510, partial [Candidatus Sumerlaeota bacterium]|nr:hypothetical protein [Candidatus Sumerlaeota bacterium]
ELNNFAQPSKMYDGYAVKFTPAVTPFSPIAVNFLCASAISGLSYMDVFILADNGGFPGTILWQALAVPVDFQAYNGQYYLAICSVQPLGLNLTGTFYVGVQWSYSANVYIAASTVSPRTGNDFYFVYDYFGNHQWQAWSFDSTADLGMEVLGTGPESTSSRDGVNNVEGIELQSPPTGLYTIRVKGTNVPQGPQPFALVISGNVSPPTTPTPTPTPVPNACGDADDDGEITPGDAQWAFECQAGQKTGDDCNPLWLDVNCSGGVTTEDATRIFQKYINNTALSCCP